MVNAQQASSLSFFMVTTYIFELLGFSPSPAFYRANCRCDAARESLIKLPYVISLCSNECRPLQDGCMNICVCVSPIYLCTHLFSR